MSIRSIFVSPVLSGLLLVAGCSGARLWPIDSQVMTQEGVRIDADSQGVGSFTVRVTNNTGQPLTVNRDAIVLQTPKGDRSRLPSKGDSQYMLSPGTSALVNVKYDTHDIEDNKVVGLKFDGAFNENGQPVRVPPMHYETRSDNE